MQSNLICCTETLFDAEQFYLQHRNFIWCRVTLFAAEKLIWRRETLFATGNFIYFSGLLGHGTIHRTNELVHTLQTERAGSVSSPACHVCGWFKWISDRLVTRIKYIMQILRQIRYFYESRQHCLNPAMVNNLTAYCIERSPHTG